MGIDKSRILIKVNFYTRKEIVCFYAVLDLSDPLDSRLLQR